MRIALAQISSSADKSENLATVAEYVGRAAERDADLVVFPEATMCRFGVPLGPVAEPVDGPWGSAIANLARDAGMTIVAGMFTPGEPRDDRPRVRNTLIAAAPDGSVTSYDKVHLYDAFGFEESRTVEAGTEPVTMQVGDVTVGLATCYDIRFPGLFQTLASQGASLIVVPASWGAGPGKLAQWRLLAAARGLDSTSYVAAVGQALPIDPAARESGAPTGIGHSLLVDPLGVVHGELGTAPESAVFDLDFAAVDAARKSVAVLANRRF